MRKPVSFDELYPGRFIKAVELLGKKVTLTIADIENEELKGEKGLEIKHILSFRETPKKHVMPKTNGLCIKAMFGKVLADWVGKRITLFESQWNGEPATRIWGSPDIPNDMEIEIKLPQKRPFKMTMHRFTVKGGNGSAAKTGEFLEQATGQKLGPAPAPDPGREAFFAEE